MGVGPVQRRFRLSVGLCLIAVVSLAFPAPALAQEEDGISAQDARAALAGVDGLLQNARPAGVSPGEIVDTGTVQIPFDAAEGVEFGGLSIGLPEADDYDSAVRLNGGTVVYPSEGDYTSAVQATPEGGVRALVVIDGPDAPTEYRFPVEGATGLLLNPDGTITVMQGTTRVAMVSAPWAVDANGALVPTSYRIEAGAIVQIVEHVGAAYPVVADPCFWGWKCLKKIVKGATGGAVTGGVGGCVLGALPTAWGGGFGCLPGAAGGAIAGAAAGAVGGWLFG